MTAPVARARGRGGVVAVLAIAGMNASFMQTIVIPIQSELPELLGASRDDTAWVITITLLVAAITTPVSGRLGDMYGKRRIALALLAILVVGAVIAAVSPGIELLIVGRGLQGAVVGVIPLGISILRDVLPEHRIGPAVALISATLGVGGAIGLPISALVSQATDWHALFWLAAGLGVVCFVLVLLVVPVSVLRTGGRFDWAGALGLAAGLAGILVAISRGQLWGWISPLTLGLLAGGVLILLGWGWLELRTRDALVDLRVVARPRVLLTDLASIAMGFGLFSANIVFPQLLELPQPAGLGLSLLVASLILLPSGLTMMILSPISGRLITIFGAKPLLIAGALVLVVSYLLSLVLRLGVVEVLLINLLIGVAIGLGYSAMPTLIMQSVPATETAAANGLNALMRSLGTAFGAAAVGAALAQSAVDLGGVPVPTADGFRVAFLLGGTAAVACVVIAAFIPRARPGQERHPALPD